jgi:hypothetical protein
MTRKMTLERALRIWIPKVEDARMKRPSSYDVVKIMPLMGVKYFYETITQYRIKIC